MSWISKRTRRMATLRNLGCWSAYRCAQSQELSPNAAQRWYIWTWRIRSNLKKPPSWSCTLTAAEIKTTKSHQSKPPKNAERIRIPSRACRLSATKLSLPVPKPNVQWLLWFWVCLQPHSGFCTFFASPCLQPLQIQAKHQVVGPFFQFQINCLAVTPKIQPVAKNLQIGSLNGHHPDCKDCKDDGAKPRSGSQESSCQHSERGNRSSKAMETRQSLEPFEWKSCRRCCRGAWPNDDEICCVHLQSNRFELFQA